MNQSEKKNDQAEGTVRHAGFLTRLYALFLDTIILGPALLPYGAVFYYHDQFVYSLLPFYTAFHSLLYIGYRFILHAKFGQTLGKKWSGIHVVDSTGIGKIGWGKSFFRILPELLLSLVTILKAYYDSRIFMAHIAEVQGLPWAGVDRILRKFNPIESLAVWDSVLYYSFSILFVIFSRKKRAIHDYIAGTKVVFKEKIDIRGVKMEESVS